MKCILQTILLVAVLFVCSRCFKLATRTNTCRRAAIIASSRQLSRKTALFSSIATEKSSITARDLNGYSLWIKFDGFNAENMNFGIEFTENFQAIFSRGIESLNPGFWRVIKYDDGKETVEITHPILPEYMFFFDIWEPSILWRGRLDFENKKIVEGEVITNKKRFGIFPYTETLATWEAQLLTPGEKLPDVELPSMGDMRFVPPADFENPYDMKRYPQLFDPEFVDYWFAAEEAIARGEEPPERPKSFFVPDPKRRADGTEAEDDELTGKSFRQRVSKSSKGDSGKAFSSKK